jgi:hypothetical protein
MTVPPLFGWENILIVLITLIVVAVAYFVASAAGTGADSRSEWQAGLDARRRERLDPDVDPAERPIEVLSPTSDPRSG